MKRTEGMLPKLMKMVEGRWRVFLSGGSAEGRATKNGGDGIATYETKIKTE